MNQDYRLRHHHFQRTIGPLLSNRSTRVGCITTALLATPYFSPGILPGQQRPIFAGNIEESSHLEYNQNRTRPLSHFEAFHLIDNTLCSPTTSDSLQVQLLKWVDYSWFILAQFEVFILTDGGLVEAFHDLVNNTTSRTLSEYNSRKELNVDSSSHPPFLNLPEQHSPTCASKQFEEWHSGSWHSLIPWQRVDLTSRPLKLRYSSCLICFSQ